MVLYHSIQTKLKGQLNLFNIDHCSRKYDIKYQHVSYFACLNDVFGFKRLQDQGN